MKKVESTIGTIQRAKKVIPLHVCAGTECQYSNQTLPNFDIFTGFSKAIIILFQHKNAPTGNANK